MFEKEEAENMANLHSDKHIVNQSVRSINEFMKDQIHFEHKRLVKLKEAA